MLPFNRSKLPEDEEARPRPKAYQDKYYSWHYGRIVKELKLAEDDQFENPALSRAVFLVHGMGQPDRAATGIALHSGIETSLEEIWEWQMLNEHQAHAGLIQKGHIPPPLIHEGYWGDYRSLPTTFPEEHASLSDEGKEYFERLWQKRAISAIKTLFWFSRNVLRLLRLRVLREVGPRTWLLYVPLQFVLNGVLFFALLRRPKVLTNYLNDVRLYLDPKGIIEKAIVQRVDLRVGAEFLRMIGLKWDFTPLAEDELIKAGGRRIQFDKVVWVAHSLGSVISFNVLSDLFHRAQETEHSGTKEQIDGVKKFRDRLHRLVTMGSPLDKVAFLFPEAIREWPDVSRDSLVNATPETFDTRFTKVDENAWWVNFYHVVDPVSGSLENPKLTRGHSPVNLHSSLGHLPGWAHVGYWKDSRVLKYILTRTFGDKALAYERIRPYSKFFKARLADLAYLTWSVLIALVLFLLFAYVSFRFREFGADGPGYWGHVGELWRIVADWVVSLFQTKGG